MDEEYSSGSDDSSCTSHATDTDGVDDIFYKCDAEKKGSILVSKLVRYLKENVGFLEQADVELDRVYDLLDPERLDKAINIDTYRSFIFKFLGECNNNNNCVSGIQDEKCCTPNSLRGRLSAVVGLSSKGDSPCNSPRMSLFHNTSLSYVTRDSSLLNQSLETIGMASGERHHLIDEPFDIGEFMSQVEPLQFHNKKLLDENSELKLQLVATEETITTNNQKIESLMKEGKNHQLTVERLQELRQENEDLKVNVLNLNEKKVELKQKNKLLERDNSSLQNSNSLLEDRLDAVTTKLESTQKIQKDLQRSLTEQRNILSEVEKMKVAQETHILEESSKVIVLEITVNDLNKVNETLRQERTDLELQLNHTQHELTSLRLKSEKIELNASDEFQDINMVNEEELMPVMGIVPPSSTPFNTHSLCSELVNRLQNEPYLPSPLCDKELEEVVELDFEEFDDDLSNILHTANLDRWTGGGTALGFMKRNEKALKGVDDLLQGYNPDSPVGFAGLKDSPCPADSPECDVVKSTGVIQKELKQNAETIAQLSTAKLFADKRIIKLKEALKMVKEQHNDLQNQYKETVDQLKSDTTEQNQKISVLDKELSSANTEKQQVVKELTDLKLHIQRLEKDVQQLETDKTELESVKMELNLTVQNLQSANAELNDIYMKSQVDHRKLQVELERISEQHYKVEEKIHELEDSLRNFQLDRQNDMQELWTLVPTDPNSSTEDVQSKALPQLTLNFERFEKVNKHGHVNQIPDKNSPLVEALTLELFNKENNSKNGDGQKMFADNLLNPNRKCHPNLMRCDSTSCPDIKVKTDTEKERKEFRLSPNRFKLPFKKRAPFMGKIFKNAEVNVSTGSSNSGVETNSTWSQAYNPDFSQGDRFNRATSDYTSAGDNNLLSPLSRRRSPSFKHAIERGPSGDSGISNPSQDNNESNSNLDLLATNPEDLLPSEEDLIKVGLYTDNNRAKIIHKRPYDRRSLHVSIDEDWSNSTNCDGYIDDEIENQYDFRDNIGGIYNNNNNRLHSSQYRDIRQGYFDNEAIDYKTIGHEAAGTRKSSSVDASCMKLPLYPIGYMKLERTLSPASLRRLSILNEAEEINNTAAEMTSQVPTAPPRKSRFRGNSTGNKEKRKSNITNDLLNKSAPLLEQTEDFPHSVNVLAHFHPKLANGKDMSINTYKENGIHNLGKSDISNNCDVNINHSDVDNECKKTLPTYAHPPPYRRAVQPHQNQLSLTAFRPLNEPLQQSDQIISPNPPPRYRKPLKNTAIIEENNTNNRNNELNHGKNENKGNNIQPNNNDSVMIKNHLKSEDDLLKQNNVINNCDDETLTRSVNTPANDIVENNVNIRDTSDKGGDCSALLPGGDVDKKEEICSKDCCRTPDANPPAFPQAKSASTTEVRRKSIESIHRLSRVDSLEEPVTSIETHNPECEGVPGVNERNDAENYANKDTADMNQDMAMVDGESKRKKSLSEISRTKTLERDDTSIVLDLETGKCVQSQTENGESDSELEKNYLKDKKVKASAKRFTSDELAQVKQGNLAKKRVLCVSSSLSVSKMPELNESPEEVHENTATSTPLLREQDSKEGTSSKSALDQKDSNESNEETKPGVQEQESKDSVMSDKMSVTSDSSRPADIRIKVPIQGGVCPSLTEKILAKWGLKRTLKDPLENSEQLSEKEIEECYTNVVLAFKTDKQTLDTRMDLQQRARDTTESNIRKEMKELKDAMQALEPFCNDAASREHFVKIQKHVNVLEVTNDRVMTRSESLGASKQEFRLSRTVDVMVKHVENLKRLYEVEHEELESTRKLLDENKPGAGDKLFRVSPSLSSSVGTRSVLKSWVTTKAGVRRRASVAVVRGTQALLPTSQSFNLRNIKQPDQKSPLKQLFDTTTSNISSVIRSPFSSRRASVAVTTSKDESSTFSHHSAQSFLNYRSNYDRLSSMSSTSSEESIYSPQPASPSVLPLFATTLSEVPEQSCNESGENGADQHISNTKKVRDKSTISVDNQVPKSHITEEISNNINCDLNVIKSIDNLYLSDNEDEEKHDKGDPNNNRNSNNSNNGSIKNVSVTTNSHDLIEPTTITEIKPSDESEVRKEDNLHLCRTGAYDSEPTAEELQVLNERIKVLIERQETLDEEECQQNEDLRLKLVRLIPDMKKFKIPVRYTFAGIVFVIGILCLIMTFIPKSQASERHYYQRHSWNSLEEILWPFVSLKRNGAPPC